MYFCKNYLLTPIATIFYCLFDLMEKYTQYILMFGCSGPAIFGFWAVSVLSPSLLWKAGLFVLIFKLITN